MNTIFLISLLFASLAWIDSTGQSKAVKFKTRFEPHTVTYNSSDKPGECVESVDSGVLIKTGEGEAFFTMPAKEVERMKEKIQDAEVLVEVVYYSVLERADGGSGASGYVTKVTLNDEVIYKNL
jgi:hypothetical protein